MWRERGSTAGDIAVMAPGNAERARSDPGGAGLIRLVRAAVRGQAGVSMKAFDEETISWAIETGLGPLLARATEHDPEAMTSPLRPLLEGATLTARLLTALHVDAMVEIIDACRGRVPPLVLLKGISMCEQHYPEPHLRPMRDIDFLVDQGAVGEVESVLSGLGYRQLSDRPPAFYESHHHSSPFVHPDTGIWVEVHHALFAARSPFGSEGTFTAPNLTTQLRSSEFSGRPVRRLSDELQVVYVACHWAHGLRAVGGMVALADMTYLLTNAPRVDWDRILGWADASVVARPLSVLLTYLDRHRLVDIDPEILRRLRATPTSPRHLALRLAHLLVDRYVVDGEDFGSLMTERIFNRVWRLVVLRRGPDRQAATTRRR